MSDGPTPAGMPAAAPARSTGSRRVAHLSVWSTRREGGRRGKRPPLPQPRTLGTSARPSGPGRAARGAGPSRVPELVPIRYGRMSVSPFAFYRGAALSWRTTWHDPALGLTAQLCGDAHLSNFGVFASPERRLVFDINDFDETLPGPWEWDVKRLAASLEIAGRERGSPTERRAIVTAAVARVPERDAPASPAGNLDVWYAHIEVDELLAEVRADDAASSRRRPRGTLPRPHPGQHAGRSPSSLRGGRRRSDRRRSTTGRADRGARFPRASAATCEEELLDLLRSYRRTLATDRRHLLEPFRYVARRPQGGRRRQRRHPRLDPAHARPRRPGSAVPAGQGGAGVGARAVRRQEQVPQPRPAGRGRPTPDAGRERHLPRLAARHRARRRRSATSTSDSCGTGRAPPRSTGCRRPDDRRIRICGATLLAPTPAPGTGSPSRRTWATATPSTRPSPTSPTPTPIRTSATTTPWSTPWTQDASRLR